VGGEEGGEEEAKPAGKGGKAAGPNKGGAAYTADIPLEALSKLPVEPLAMDAAALKDDDAQFELFSGAVGGEKSTRNIDALDSSLKKAVALMHKMHRDVEAEKVWTKNVYDIIQNYQYKYLKTIEDVKQREKKLAKMEKLVELLKASTLHAGVEHELQKAENALSELVKRAGTKGKLYGRITRRMAKLKQALNEVQTPRQLHSETTAKIKKILHNDIPPVSSDALSKLVGAEDEEEEAQPAPTPKKDNKKKPAPASKKDNKNKKKDKKKAAPKKAGAPAKRI